MSEPEAKKVSIPEVLTVKQFADRADLSVTAIISDLMKNGVLASINETIDFETAQIVGVDLGIEVIKEENETKKSTAIEKTEVANIKDLVLRPPVVAIMGHVDHGKTSLLDRIRAEHVAEGESGGITQHISAYQITLDKTKKKDVRNKTITFIDTPGHAAFSAMREHGSAITDIIVLIVAADDGVMPQTIEVIEEAKSNSVPVIVAINKVDLPGADVMKIKQQLSDHELIPEDWGGKTVMVEISAKSGQGIDDLLEVILLQADLMELKANPKEQAVGVVIEAHMQKGAGPLATILVENGTLNRCDAIAIGSVYGKVRILEDFAGKPIESAGPSTPVRVAGLKSLPGFGDHLVAFSSDREAKNAAVLAETTKPTVNIATAKRINENEEGEKMAYYELKLIIKCDVKGSLEALKKSFNEIVGADYSIKLISEGVGAVSESDVTLAIATGAQVLGFRINVSPSANKMAEKDGIKVKNFQVIYELIDYAKAELAAILPPDVLENELGTGKVLAIFRDDKKGFVAGGILSDGHVTNGDEVKFFQGTSEKYRATISSLRREKSEAKEIDAGTEFGFGLPIGANIAVGDKFTVFKTELKTREIK